MEAELISLFIIVLSALICPILTQLLPNKIIPETVFLLIAGMVIGPNMLGWVQGNEAVTLLSDLGLGFLFLLAGYEIDIDELKGKGGRSGLRTWFVTFAIALALMVPLGAWRNNIPGGLAAAIILTTTAFGTLVPILKERKLTGTSIGKCVVEYGIWGELCPVLAMAVLLSTRATWVTVMLLVLFIIISVIAGFLSKRLQREGSRSLKMLKDNAETNSQMTVRASIFLLVSLVTVSALFDLDIVLGAFAAGFVLRVVLPEGDDSLEHKLDGIAYGFFIPLFFIVSGMKIDPMSVAAEPLLLIIFIVALLFVRAVPIYVSLSLRKDTRHMRHRSKAAVAFYCTTALPLIVAVTTIATTIGAVSQETASVLIAAGGITVLIMPLAASITMHTIDADLGEAAKEIAANPKSTAKILKKHHQLERERSKKNRHVLSNDKISKRRKAQSSRRKKAMREKEGQHDE